MKKKDFKNWIMYHEIHKLARLGFSSRKIARYLVLDIRTVNKYLQMSEDDYEQSLLKTQNRPKILSLYEGYVKDKLIEFPDTSAAQMYDWLKESHADLPKASSRSAYNFVKFIRQKYNFPFARLTREYFVVEEEKLPVVQYSRDQIRDIFEQFGVVTKYEISQWLLTEFKEQETRKPRERKLWTSEDRNMAIFDALSLGMTWFYLNE